MTTQYDDDKFESESGSEKGAAASNALYNLKFSVDIRSVKNMKVAGNAVAQFSLNLGAGKGSKGQFHQFKSD